MNLKKKTNRKTNVYRNSKITKVYVDIIESQSQQLLEEMEFLSKENARLKENNSVLFECVSIIMNFIKTNDLVEHLISKNEKLRDSLERMSLTLPYYGENTSQIIVLKSGKKIHDTTTEYKNNKPVIFTDLQGEK